MTHRKQYEEKHGELRNIMDTLESRLCTSKGEVNQERPYKGSRFKSMVEICPRGINGCKYPCICDNYSESDMHIEKIEELEDYILELREQIVNFQKHTPAQYGQNSDVKHMLSSNVLNKLLDLVNVKVDELEKIIKDFSSKLCNVAIKLRGSIKSMHRSLVNYKEQLAVKNKEHTKMNKILEDYKKQKERISTLEKKLTESDSREKRLRNEVIDLKGAIRVFCRIRPVIRGEKACEIKSTNEKIEISNGSDLKSLSFQYDRIFCAFDSQEKVFEEVAPLVRSGMDGYKVCIFAYGQTGSGKTYTMEGYGVSNGIIYKSIDEIFNISAEMEKDGWSLDFDSSVVEIYNENIKDLLSNDGKKVEVRHVNDKTVLNNCIEHTIRKKEDLTNLFNIARKNRSVGATMSNEMSSRSHSVFILKVKMSNTTLKEYREGIFNFIDLAGSERLHVSKAEGERLRETQNINKSLSVLGNVITALVRKEQHVPFRDSKLTLLLKDHLQGNSRVLMFVNIAPEAKYHGETICSLRFAAKISECKFGPAQRNFYRET
eukprot:jgi/Antlo1/342/807